MISGLDSRLVPLLVSLVLASCGPSPDSRPHKIRPQVSLAAVQAGKLPAPTGLKSLSGAGQPRISEKIGYYRSLECSAALKSLYAAVSAVRFGVDPAASEVLNYAGKLYEVRARDLGRRAGKSDTQVSSEMAKAAGTAEDRANDRLNRQSQVAIVCLNELG